MEPVDQNQADIEFGMVLLLTGLAALFLAGLVWWELRGLASGDSVRLNVIVAVAYKLGGKPLAIGGFLVPGVAMVGAGKYFLIGALKKK